MKHPKPTKVAINEVIIRLKTKRTMDEKNKTSINFQNFPSNKSKKHKYSQKFSELLKLQD